MTTDTPTPSPTLNDEATPKLSTLDRLLPVWIGVNKHQKKLTVQRTT